MRDDIAATNCRALEALNDEAVAKRTIDTQAGGDISVLADTDTVDINEYRRRVVGEVLIMESCWVLTHHSLLPEFPTIMPNFHAIMSTFLISASR